jgi:hypothetical protein
MVKLISPPMVLPDDSLSEVCYKLDKGGGVTIEGAFAIHSIARLPPHWDQRLQKPSISVLFEQKASAVATTIPLYWDSSNDQRKTALTVDSIPYAGYWPNKQTLTDRKPEFLLNASKIERHCLVVGPSGLVRTLLVILQRTWCVLEICCCSLATLDAMLEFAQLAEKLDPANYTIPVFLLSHEKRKREADSSSDHVHGGFFQRAVLNNPHGGGSLPNTLNKTNNTPEMYAAIFASSASAVSLNGEWLRILCLCGLQLDLAYSVVCKAFHDNKEEMTTYLFSVYDRALKILVDHVS